MKFKKILMFVGTRPECIKMLPIYLELRKINCEVEICDTGQHLEMNSQVFNFFDVIPKYSLQSMKTGQSLSELSSKMLMKSSSVIQEYDPDLVLVHGDTMTSFICAFSAFLNKAKVGHIEAGLRTNNKWSPYPEEMNRILISDIADLHFAPTQWAKNNLLAEGINENQIFVVGNTAMDAIKFAEKKVKSVTVNLPFKRVLVTIHRRENHGKNLSIICKELMAISLRHSDVEFIVSLHPNPDIQKVMFQYLGTASNIKLKKAMPYGEFISTMHTSYIIITDSGGIQEEVTLLGIPTLVIREYTERPEAIEYGPCVLITNIVEELSKEVDRLLTNDLYYKERSRSSTVFGNGSSSMEITSIISKY